MIKIVTDSTAYTTREYAQQNGITIIPLSLILDGNSYEEGFPGDFEPFYMMMESSADHPRSSQPAPEKFKDAFDRIIADGDEVLCITLSSALSGTNNSARLAAGMSTDESRITLFDTQGCAHVSLLYIEEAVRLINEGKTRAEILNYLTRMTEESSEVFVPLSLKYLIKGGRIGGVSAVIGSLLHVKPLLAFKQGVLACSRKVIGMQKAIKEILTEVPKTARSIYVMVIQKSPFFEQLMEKVKEAFPQATIKKGDVGPVIGAHVGPGAIGVAYTSMQP